MVTLANGFSARGHDVDLVLLCGTGDYAGEVKNGVNVVDLGARTAATAALPLRKYFAGASRDAVLSTLIAPNAITVLAARSRANRPRVVVREANTISAALAYRSPLDRVVAGAVARRVYPLADAIVAVSEDARSDLATFLDLDPARIVAIANPVDLDDIESRAAEALSDPWFSAERDVPVIVAAGRLVPKKGFDVLLEALALVRKSRRVRLVILGRGDERTNLERRVDALGLSNDVKLPGFVDNPFAWFARADLFALSSFAEGMPNALLQAMACGCPVISTNCPSGPREILEDGRHGLLVPPGDAQALAAAIEASLDAPVARRADVRARARHFAADSAVDAYLRILAR